MRSLRDALVFVRRAQRGLFQHFLLLLNGRVKEWSAYLFAAENSSLVSR